ncbi:hypothetical protein N9K16_01605 [Alphaproteobacteria bacterium]|nr:hypothetical protein [Alphaproteobacteria bacterium]
MPAFYKRVASLSISGQGGGQSTTQLRTSFTIDKDRHGEPNDAEIKVYNLNPGSRAALKEEYKQIQLTAGYVGNARLIFDGQIHEVKHRYESPDWISTISAKDGREGYRKAFVSETVDTKVASTQELVKRAVKPMEAFNIKTGDISLLSKEKDRLKPVSFFASAAQVLNELAARDGFHWSIQDGEFEAAPYDKPLPGQLFVISEQTGMIGSPEVEEEGKITVRSLLNPAIKVNRAVQVVSRQPEASGLYKITKITHKGDTHSNEWETVIMGEPF